MTRNERRRAAAIALFEGATTPGEAAAAAAAIQRIEAKYPETIDHEGPYIAEELQAAAAYHGTENGEAAWMRIATEAISEHAARWSWNQVS